ncbi:MAG: hypothetical protein K1X83_08740 [Oligoflexia bacterium]|nr:hypothetical protein [Oligoflexia bacterium]
MPIQASRQQFGEERDKVFISQGQAEITAEAERTAPRDAELPAIDVDSYFEVLHDVAPRNGPAALSQIKELLDLIARPEVRERLIDAMRLDSPKQFVFSEVRCGLMRALTEYRTDPEVVKLCVEEFQTHPRDEESCRTAMELLKDIDLGQYKSANDFLNQLLADNAAVLASTSPNPGVKYAAQVVRGAASDAVEETVIKRALEVHRSGAAGIDEVETLARLQSAKGVQVLKEIALGRVYQRKWSPHASIDFPGEIQTFLVPFCAVVVGLVFTGITFLAKDHGFLTQLPSPRTVGIFTGALALPLLLAGMRGWYSAARHWLYERQRNPQMAEAALIKLASLLPNSSLEEDLLATLGNPDTPANVREKLALGFRNCGAPETVNKLIGFSQGKDKSLRLLALSALASKVDSDPHALEAINAASEDYDPEIRRATLKILARSRADRSG